MKPITLLQNKALDVDLDWGDPIHVMALEMSFGHCLHDYPRNVKPEKIFQAIFTACMAELDDREPINTWGIKLFKSAHDSDTPWGDTYDNIYALTKDFVAMHDWERYS